MSAARVINGDKWTATANGNHPHDRMQKIVPMRLPFYWHWFTWENLRVAGREVKGWVVPQPLGIAVLVLLLGGIGTIYWRMNDRITTLNDQNAKQSELLIRLDQRLMDKSDRDKEFRQEVNSHFESVTAWQEVTNKNLAEMKARRN